MKLETIPAHKLSDAECAALKRLTLGREKGQMVDALEDWRYDVATRVIRLTDDDGKVLCWAIHHYYDNRGNKDFQIYCRASERGKGYAKMVYDRAVRSAGGRKNLIVHPYDKASTAFYNKVHQKPQGLPLFNEGIK